jgi:hypothetical protein
LKLKVAQHASSIAIRSIDVLLWGSRLPPVRFEMELTSLGTLSVGTPKVIISYTSMRTVEA